MPEPRAGTTCTCPPPAAGGIVGVNRGHLLGCPVLSDYDPPCDCHYCAAGQEHDPDDQEDQ